MSRGPSPGSTRRQIYKTGVNGHIALIHGIRCKRPQRIRSWHCRACLIDEYDAKGIVYLPSHESWPASIADYWKYPGFRDDVCRSRPWNYGPMKTSQEILDINLTRVNSGRDEGRDASPIFSATDGLSRTGLRSRRRFSTVSS